MSTSNSLDNEALMKKALLEIRGLRAKLESLERTSLAKTTPDPIAIIGMACRFPKAPNVAAFWDLLARGGDAVVDIPKERWDAAEFYDPDPNAPGKMYVTGGGFLDEIDQFSPSFFGISPREAIYMDPQQRLLLEVGWEALEDAAIPPDRLLDSQVGVFVGIGTTDYGDLQILEGPQAIDAYNGTGGAHSAAAGRISYLLGVRGPSLAVDTACSSSLAAVHLAVNSLRHGESDVALVGGVNLTLSPDVFISLCKARMLSPDSRCKAFDAHANGYVRGEGCGVVILKRLSAALADGDRIHAVIRGSAINHDGRSSGLTVPSGPAQQELIRRALSAAGIKPSDVAYVEAHGTGTAVGDPIEVGALGNVYGDRAQPLWIGSVKTNTGHLEWAAGIAGLIKMALCLRHGQIPASLHFHEPNPHIEWDRLPIRVVTEMTPWPEGPRIGGVSSFGFGGTNGHLLVEQAPALAQEPAHIERPLHLLTLSAKSEAALRELAKRYDAALGDNSAAPLPDACYTANSGRSQFEHRLTSVASSAAQMQSQLRAAAAGELPAGLRMGRVAGDRPKLAMLFTGQGSQYAGMGRELFETQPVFRHALDRCDEILRPEMEHRLLDILYPGGQDAESRQRIDQTGCTQPALFALEYALAEMWQSWGVRPDLVMGHSVGEYPAACLAGVFSLEDGLRLIAARGRLMQALPRDGAMVAIRAAEERVVPFLEPYRDSVSLAAVNGPHDVVISGERSAVAAIVAQLQNEGVAAVPLQVSHAFHSPLMEPMLAEFARVAGSIRYRAPQIGLISNLTGKEARAEVTEPSYWVRHVRETVRFASGMTAAAERGCEVFLEAGPNPVLCALGRQSIPAEDVEWAPSLRSKKGDWQQTLESLAALHLRGVKIDWAGFDSGYSRRKVELPAYPFERQRYWYPHLKSSQGQRRSSLRPLVDTMTRSPLIRETVFTAPFSTVILPYLADHRVFDEVVVPGACYLSMLLSAGELLGYESCRIEDAFFLAPMTLRENEERTMQAVLTPDDAGHTCQLVSMPAKAEQEEMVSHVTARIAAGTPGRSAEPSLAAAKGRCQTAVEPEELFASLPGIEFGPAFRWIEELRVGQREVVAHLRAPGALGGADGYWFHPTLLDACFQTAGATLLGPEGPDDVLLPFAVKGLEARRPAEGSEWWCHAARTGEFVWDLRLYDAAGRLVVEMREFEMRKAPRQAFLRKRMAEWAYRIEWQAQPAAARPFAEDPGTWLILAGRNGLHKQVLEKLAEHHQRCVVAFRGDAFAPLATNGDGNSHTFTLDPQQPEDFERLFRAALTPQDPPCRGIVNFWSADPPPEASATPACAQSSAVDLLHLVQALDTAKLHPPLWLVTEGVQSVHGGEPIEPSQAPVWGFGRTLSLERPDLPCVCVDLMPAEPGNAAALVAELALPFEESQTAWRSGVRHVARLVRQRDRRRPKPAGAFRVQLGAYGTPDQLQLAPLDRRKPVAWEVEVEVKAASLSFRDILNSLGLLKEYYADALGIHRAQDVPIGFDCAGTVVAVGEDVTSLKAGDEVMVASPGGCSSFITCYHELAVPKAKSMSFESASAAPSVFLTAYHGLVDLAGLKAGDRVLIHAAAGGVGQAAVQLAQAVGAEIFATASPGKWAFLKAQGVAHVMNSRTLDFAGEILRLTGGEGVDVVLNSLNGPAIAGSFEVLKKGGRFVEIGKLGIWTQKEVAERRPDASYFTFDLQELIKREPSLVTRILGLYGEWFEAGRLPALPQTVFPVEDTIEAYRYMQQTRHIGKVVLDFASESAPAVRDDASYLVTGGLGVLGLKIAEHLATMGARHLVLAGRRAPGPDALRAIEQLRASGVSVDVAQADIADPDEASRLIAICRARAPLRGIVHSAGVLDDGVIENQTAQRFAAVMAPKIHGAWNLHWHTQSLPLDFFVCFSSIASLLGSPGQSNYAAANAFLDALAHHRRMRGLPALSVNWGPWAGVGMAAGLSLAGQGLEKLDAESGAEIFGQLIQPGQRAASPQIAVVRANWSALARMSPESGQSFFSQLLRQNAQPNQAASGEFLTRFHSAPAGDRAALVEAFVHGQLTQVLGLNNSQRIEPTQSWLDLGLDSLTAVELKNRLERALRVTLPVDRLMRDPSLRGVADFLAAKLNDSAPLPSQPEGEAGNAADGPPVISEEEFAKIRERVMQIPQAFLTVEETKGRQVLIDGRWRRDFASCSYLGLDLHPEMRAAVPAAQSEWGINTNRSRVIASPRIYLDLEQELAALVGAPKVLTFSAISLLHQGVLPALAGYNGVILKDTAAHHSVHEGCIRAQANGIECIDFRHNDVDDLARKIARYRADRVKVIAIDGVYSMGLSHPPLAQYATLAKAHNAILYIDDAHGFGVLGGDPDAAMPYGYHGGGMVRHFGLDYIRDRIVYVGGFSKAFTSTGAFVTCFDDEMRMRLHYDSPIMFSNPAPIASVASTLAGLRINSRDGDERRRHIYRLTRRFVDAVRSIGFEADNAEWFPIVGVILGDFEDTVRTCRLLWEQDILITPAVYPSVPTNRNLARFQITAAHTDEDVDTAIRALEHVWAKAHHGTPVMTASLA